MAKRGQGAEQASPSKSTGPKDGANGGGWGRSCQKTRRGSKKLSTLPKLPPRRTSKNEKREKGQENKIAPQGPAQGKRVAQEKVSSWGINRTKKKKKSQDQGKKGKRKKGCRYPKPTTMDITGRTSLPEKGKRRKRSCWGKKRKKKNGESSFR